MSLAAILLGLLANHVIDETLGEGLPSKFGKSLYDWATQRFGKEKAERLNEMERIARAIAARTEFVVREASPSDTELLNVVTTLTLALRGIDPVAEIIASIHEENQQKILTERLYEECDINTLTTRERDFLNRAASELAEQLYKIGPNLEGWTRLRDKAELSELREIAKQLEDVRVDLELQRDKPKAARTIYAKLYRETIERDLDYVEILGLDEIDRGQREAKLSIAYLSLTMHGGEMAGEFHSLLLDAVKNPRIFVIEGGAGSGKSTLLRWAAIIASRMYIVKNKKNSVDNKNNAANKKSNYDSDLMFSNIITFEEYFERMNYYVQESDSNRSNRSVFTSVEDYHDIEMQDSIRGGLIAVPFLLRLRKYPDGMLPALEDWPREILPSIEKPPEGFVVEALKEGSALLLFDGVDEIPEGAPREKALRTISSYFRQYPSTLILIASRPRAFDPDSYDGLHQAEIHVVNDLSHHQQADFVRNWHTARVETRSANPSTDYSLLGESLIVRLQLNPPLARIATNPLLCAAICALHERQPETLPSDERGLCDKLTMLMLTRDAVAGRTDPVVVEEFGPEYALGREDRRQLLAYLAHRMVERGRSQVGWEDAVALMPKALREIGQGSLDPERMLRALSMRSPPLRMCSGAEGGEAVEFLHNRFKEWLASTWFLSEEEHEALVRHAEKEDYAETLVLAASAPDRRKYADRLIAGLMKRAEGVVESTEVRRALDVLGLRAALAAPRLSEDLRLQATELQSKLLPPRNFEEAKALSLAGDPVVQWLEQTKPVRDGDESAFCIRCLALVNTPKALSALEGYRDDSRMTVLRELIRIYDGADLDALWVMNEKFEVAPPGEFRDRIQRLPDLSPETRLLDLSGTRVSKIELLSTMKQLIGLDLKGTHVDDVTSLANLQALIRLDLTGTRVRDVTSLSNLKALRTLYLVRTMVHDVAALDHLNNLEIIR